MLIISCLKNNNNKESNKNLLIELKKPIFARSKLGVLASCFSCLTL